MRSSEPQSTDPTGAPSPLEKQNITVSASAAIVAASTPSASAALKILAPSRYTGMARRLAAAVVARIISSAMTVPPVDVSGFSQTRRLTRGR
ncbi:hypothetical protein BMS3Bbin01_02976 [bacterium BMS3Bbin01]|nr:hypothetical protein BMS3Bbin01_02976 [bacterium BMS3Bbin01]